MHTFTVLFVVMVSQVYAYIKTCQNIYFKYVKLIAHHLCLNKTVEN